MNVELRDVVETDLPVFYEHQADADVAAMAGFKPRDRDAFFLHWRTKVLGDALTRKQSVLVDGRLVGNVVAFHLGGKRLVGYWYGREAWGRGIATRALSKFLELETHRPICAYVIPANVASMRVLEKNGFVRGAQHVADDGIVEVLFTRAA